MDEPGKAGAQSETTKTNRESATLYAVSEPPPGSENRAGAPISLPPEAKSLVPSAALIAVGLILESELLVGIALGTGIVIASKWLPQAAGEAVRPIVNGTILACHSAAAKTSEMLGEAAQRVEGIVTSRTSDKEKAAGPGGGQAKNELMQG